MNSRRTFLVMLGIATLGTWSAAFAQQPKKGARIGFLAVGSDGDPNNMDAFRRGMRELGYREGSDYTLELRHAPSLDRLPAVATDLVQLNLDVIVASNATAALALRKATSTTAIVVAIGPDPVAIGLANSYARPGGNVTGLGDRFEVTGKRLEILKQMLPHLTSVAVILNSLNPYNPKFVQELQAAASKLAVRLLMFHVQKPGDIERAFATMRSQKAGAVFVLPDGLLYGQRALICALALKQGLPSMFALRGNVLAGGLMSYGHELSENIRRSTAFVDRIIKGAKPGDIPFEQPMKYTMTLNRTTAKALGLSIPGDFLVRVDEVIE